MRITTITYQAVKNLGNYSSERLEMTAIVEEGEDPLDAALRLRQRVNLILMEECRFDPESDPPDDLPEDF